MLGTRSATQAGCASRYHPARKKPCDLKMAEKSAVLPTFPMHAPRSEIAMEGNSH
jgi:hypothetical protein